MNCVTSRAHRNGEELTEDGWARLLAHVARRPYLEEKKLLVGLPAAPVHLSLFPFILPAPYPFPGTLLGLLDHEIATPKLSI